MVPTHFLTKMSGVIISFTPLNPPYPISKAQHSYLQNKPPTHLLITASSNTTQVQALYQLFSKPVKQPPTHLLLPSIAPLLTSSQHDRKILITSCHCPGPKLCKSFSLHLLLNPKSLPYTTTRALSVFAPQPCFISFSFSVSILKPYWLTFSLSQMPCSFPLQDLSTTYSRHLEKTLFFFCSSLLILQILNITCQERTSLTTQFKADPLYYTLSQDSLFPLQHLSQFTIILFPFFSLSVLHTNLHENRDLICLLHHSILSSQLVPGTWQTLNKYLLKMAINAFELQNKPFIMPILCYIYIYTRPFTYILNLIIIIP